MDLLEEEKVDAFKAEVAEFDVNEEKIDFIIKNLKSRNRAIL